MASQATTSERGRGPATAGPGRRLRSAVVAALALLSVSALAVSALSPQSRAAIPFGPDSSNGKDFTFYFSVQGYRANSWFSEPSALALDERSGLIYVADQKAGAVYAFSLQGVAKFQYSDKQGLKAPVGLAVDRQGNVYVSENAGGPIKIINNRGDVSKLDLPAETEPGKETPKAGRMSIDRDGNLYVVDRANNQVLVFDRDRKLKFKFGQYGNKRGEFKLLQDVATDRQGRIYTADAIGVPIQVFDRKGNYIYGFGVRGVAQDTFGFPAGLFVDRQDQVWVVDKTQHNLKVFDRSGMFLKSFGSYGQEEGSLFYPIAAVEDSLGHVFVLEFGARRLQVFTLSRPFDPFTP